MPFPVPDVLAEWAYSEIVDGISASQYAPYVTDELRAKRKKFVPFSRLSRSDRYALARACYNVRPLILVHLIGITHFNLVDITRTDLASNLVPPHAAKDLDGQYAHFEQYMTIPSADPNDARYNSPIPENWQASETPLTFGYVFQHRVLIDGFHRAATFWRCHPTGGVLKAYVPQDAPTLHRERPQMHEEDRKDLSAFLLEFQEETDRGAALVGAALIDQRLKETLRSFMVSKNAASQLLEGGTAPLGTFSSRIDACYALGLISAHEQTECDLIRAAELRSQPIRTSSLRDRRTKLWSRMCSRSDYPIPLLCPQGV